VRLSPHTAQRLWSFSMDSHEASVPISPAPQYIPHGQLARSLGTFGPIFPKARGLRHQSSSWRAQLSWAPTTMPEDISQVLIPDQKGCPNSYRLMNNPITRSCMRSVLEKHSVLYQARAAAKSFCISLFSSRSPLQQPLSSAGHRLAACAGGSALGHSQRRGGGAGGLLGGASGWATRGHSTGLVQRAGGKAV
jgi:hypothetical protein